MQTVAKNTQVRCIILPFDKHNILLPNTLVAEITTYDVVASAPFAPRWIKGMIFWRGKSIPLVAIWHMLGSAHVDTPSKRIAVLNSVTGNDDLPFYAIEVWGLPRLLMVGEDVLQEIDVPTFVEEDPVLLEVTSGDLTAVIPDIDAIESTLAELGVKLG